MSTDEEMVDAGATETPGEAEFSDDLEDALDRIRMVSNITLSKGIADGEIHSCPEVQIQRLHLSS
jgi:hypothetical protein